MHTTLAQLAPATPVAQAVQAALGAAPAVASSAASALSEAAITPASGDALGKDTPDAARGCTPIRPRDLLVQRDMFGGATAAPEADHTVTTKVRKPRARKASRPVAVAPCDHFLKVRIPGELHEQLMAKAGARGQRLGTLVRDLLQAQTQTDDLAGAVNRLEHLVREATEEPTTHGGKDLVLETYRQGQELHAMLTALCSQADPELAARVLARVRGV